MEQDKIPEVDKVDEVDFDRWYRELFKKFTTIRDAYETNGVGTPGSIDTARILLSAIKIDKQRSRYENASEYFEWVMQSWNQK
jgi:hypothetical protein